MRKILPFLFLSLVVASVATAQGVTPKTAAGDKALIFSINGFGDFGVGGSLAGYVPATLGAGADTLGGGSSARALPIAGFGVKYYLADRMALRASLGVGLNSTSTPAADSNGTDDTESRFTIAISPALEFHFLNEGPVSGYAGAFVGFGMTSISNEGADSVESSRSGSVFSGGAMVGVEFFPWSNVSLGAEYQLGVQAVSESSSFLAQVDAETKKTIEGNHPSYFNLGVSSVAVMLGIYF